MLPPLEDARVEEVGALFADDCAVVLLGPLGGRPVVVHDAGDEGVPPALDPPLVEGDEGHEPSDLGLSIVEVSIGTTNLCTG